MNTQQTGNELNDPAQAPVLIAGTLRRYWWLILTGALVGGSVAYWVAGRHELVYRKSASVMMRDTRQGSEASTDRILSELGVDSGAANLANESFVLKSTVLMQSVVDKLGLNTKWLRPEGFRRVDLYDRSPLRICWAADTEPGEFTLDVIPLNEKEYALRRPGAEGWNSSTSYAYGQPVNLPFATISITPTHWMRDSDRGTAFRVQHEPAEQTVRRLLDALLVTRPDEKEASLLELSLTATDPQRAEDVLNELIAAYNRHSRKEKSEAARKTESFIMERLRELGEELGQVAENIKQAKEGADIVLDADATLAANYESARELRAQIFRKETERKLLDALSAEVERSQAEGGLLTVETGLGGGLQNKVELYNSACLEYGKFAASAGSRNPVAVSLKEKMEAALAATHQSLEHCRKTLDIELHELREKQQELLRGLAAASAGQMALQPLIREQKVKEELYLRLLAKEQENALALAIAEPSARVLESAHGSDAPVAPRTVIYVAIGSLGGGTLCLLFLVGAGLLNTSVRNKHDLEGISALPVLAELPILSRKARKSPHLCVQDAHSDMAESLHILRNNVEHLLPRSEKGAHIIIITSTTPNEGKSFIAANLAATFAQAGRRVLLVDADLRKRSLSRALGGKGHRGLTDLLLQRNVTTEELIHRLPELEEVTGRADILYSGTRVPNPITLLTSPVIGELLTGLRKQYDAIILDSPPCGILADTDLLAAQADICLYVIRAGIISRHYLREVDKLATEGRLPTTAFVLNAVNFRAAGHYYYYGYSYGYGATQKGE